MKQQVKFKLVEIPDKALKECLVIENCIAYVSLILQFSIWKTATIWAINHAVIHNSMAHRDYNEKGANIQIDYSLGLTPQLAAFGSFIWKHS